MAQNQTRQYDGKDEYIPASLAKRAGAIFYDLLIVTAILFIATIFWTAAGVTLGHPLYPVYVGFVYLTAFAYFGWCWTHGGQTVGMKVWKIKLLATGTRRFGWMAAMTRSATAMFSVVAFGAGFWWTLFNRDKSGWHDQLSNSRLIQL